MAGIESFRLIRESILNREESERVQGNFLYLQKAIRQYSLDASRKGEKRVFPENLETLVDDNYLNAADLYELMDGKKILYLKPPDDAKGSATLLEVFTGNRVFTCSLDGKIKIQTGR